MKALILNSGVGKRMGELTRTKNKCMAEIGPNTTIIDWQIQTLQKSNISDIVITTGPFAGQLTSYVTEQYPDINFMFFQNPLYETTNYIYSIAMAADALEDDILLMHGDLVFEESVLKDSLYADMSTMVIDTTLPLPEKDFKAVIVQDKIAKVGIEFFKNAYAAQPLYKLMKKDWLVWLDNILNFCKKGVRDVYAENALNEISEKIMLYPLDVKGRICAEIDNLDDLTHIQTLMKKYF